ncbi:MAG TPA: DUF4403 family protein [Thermoanaerobaculia bacterium]|nr:DUF4403 family protein [Thermoanaerobaculia bacterium]
MTFCGTGPSARPAARPTPDLPDDQLSTIAIPIEIPLAPIVDRLEQSVPKAAARLDGFELDPQQRFGIRYRIERTAINLSAIGTGLHATTTLRYSLEACRRTFNPVTSSHTMWPCGSCGFGETARVAEIALHSTLQWDTDWRLRSRTTARPVEFPNRCRVTLLNIDITDWKIAPAANAQLRAIAASIDRETPRLSDIRALAEKIWMSIQAPIELAPGTWLVIDPKGAGFGPIGGNGSRIGSTLHLRANARITVGQRPAVALAPLPPLEVQHAAARGLNVLATVSIPYPEVSRNLNEQLGGKSFDKGRLLVKSVEVTAGREGKALVRASIRYRGGPLKQYEGDIELEGDPQIDRASRSIALTNVSYSLPSRRGLFFRIASSLSRESIRAAIERNARWSASRQLELWRVGTERAANRALAPGVHLRSRVTALEPVGISAKPEAIVISMSMQAEASIEISDAKRGR